MLLSLLAAAAGAVLVAVVVLGGGPAPARWEAPPLTAVVLHPLVPPVDQLAAAAAGATLPLWAVANEGGNSGAARDGLRDVDTFPLITAQPGAYSGQLLQMRRARPDAMVLGYVNATFAPPAAAGRLDPGQLVRDASGAPVRSRGYGNQLVDPRDPQWVASRVETCRSLIRDDGYTGCMLDMLGIAPLRAGYSTGVPLDPRTGQPWTPADWLAATGDIVQAVRDGVGPSVVVIGNGLDNGTRYADAGAPSSVLLDRLDGGIVETWLRPAASSLDTFRDVASWQADVDMLVDAGERDRSVFVLLRVWGAGRADLTEQWRRYGIGSFLLGSDGHSFFTISTGPADDPTAVEDGYGVDIGTPVGRYTPVAAGEVVGQAVDPSTPLAYRRDYTGGLVLVNPTSAPVRVVLDRAYDVVLGPASVRGAVGGPVLLPAHDALVLRTPTAGRL